MTLSANAAATARGATSAPHKHQARRRARLHERRWAMRRRTRGSSSHRRASRPAPTDSPCSPIRRTLAVHSVSAYPSHTSAEAPPPAPFTAAQHDDRAGRTAAHRATTPDATRRTGQCGELSAGRWRDRLAVRLGPTTNALRPGRAVRIARGKPPRMRGLLLRAGLRVSRARICPAQRRQGSWIAVPALSGKPHRRTSGMP
jgi:hypothetical protein